MYVDDCQYIRDGKKYRRVLLREGFREQGKVKHRTIANISNCTEKEIEAIKFALKNKKDLTQIKVLKDSVRSEQGPSVGAVIVLKAIADRLHITKGLGDSEMGRMALWQVMARVIDQGSRLSAVRLARKHAVVDVLNIDGFDEDDLYSNLDWLSENQARIELNLFKSRFGDTLKPILYLYDVTSSYLEGVKNALGDWGYNRDKKKGKLQIVIGLLLDGDGIPVSVEVFKGNTNDTKTVLSQIQKLAGRFGVTEVTVVGDRGMIKSTQIEQLKIEHFHYITAITKPQIESLIKKGIMQIDMFDKEICEIEQEGIRYILRKNSVRAKEIEEAREQKINSLSKFVKNRNEYILEHDGSDLCKQKNEVSNRIKRLKLSNYVSCEMDDGQITLSIDNDKKIELSLLDGCYIIKTDLNKEKVASVTVHDRYKDLALVERGFRTMKTGLLETRPIYVRKESRTRGHVFVVMLSYILIQELTKRWSELDITVEEGIKELSAIDSITIKVGDSVYNQIPHPRDLGKELLRLANVSLPDRVPYKKSNVATKRKLTNRKK